MNYFLRNNETDFRIWYRRIVPMTTSFLNAYEKDSIRLIIHKEEYRELLIIKEQVISIKALLNEKQMDFFESYLMRKQLPEWGDNEKWALYDDIYHYWQQVCFPNGKSRVKDINPVLLGGELRRQRVIRGMSIKQVAEIIGISRKTLYTYEEGTREMKVSTLYKLCQVYKTEINDVLSVSGSEDNE